MLQTRWVAAAFLEGWILRRALKSGADRLTAETVGTRAQLALARATRRAIDKTAQSLATDADTQEHLSRVLTEVFDSAKLPEDDVDSVLEAVVLAVDRSLFPLDDPTLTPGEQSALADLGVELQTARRVLIKELLTAIQFEATRSQDLSPLAAQLNADKLSWQVSNVLGNLPGATHLDGHELPPALGRVDPQPSFSPITGGDQAASVRTDDCAELIAELARRSAIAAEDAAIVSRTGNELVTLESLYVPRTRVEAECSALAAASTLALVGEAGNGKTSLLWAIYQRLIAAGRTVVFLRAAQLDAAAEDGADYLGSLGRRLVSGLRCPTADGKHPVVLLDTVDALLHREATRDRLLLLVGAVAETGASTVLACRPLESRLLPRAVQRLDLPGYLPDELITALTGHQKVFGQRPMPQETADRLVNAVRWESPMLPILQRPLALRMLFELYAPEDIPAEINTFGLFLRFWTNRVEADVRPGSISVDSEDLGSAVFYAAIEMLARGGPSISSAIAQTRPEFDVATADTLRSRGVLRQGQDYVEFFHQSFLEHCAGRAIAVNGGPTGMDALLNRAEARPTDAFLWPVVEQALLYKRELDGLERYLTRLVSWCRGPVELSFNAAIGVWANSISPLPGLAQVLADYVSPDTPDARVRALVNLLPTVPSNRSDECVLVAEAVWRTERPTLRRLLLDALPVLAQRDSSWTLAFLTDAAVVSELCSEKLVDKLVSVATALVRLGANESDRERSIRVAEGIVTTFDEHPLGGFFKALCMELASDENTTAGIHSVDRWVEFLSAATPGPSSYELAPVLSVAADIQQLDVGALLENAAQNQGSIAQAWLQVACQRMVEADQADSPFVDEVLALPTETLHGAMGDFADLIGRDPALVSRVWDAVLEEIACRDRFRLSTLSRVLDSVQTEFLGLALEKAAVAFPDEYWKDEGVLGRLLVAAAITGHAQAVRVLESEVVHGSKRQRNRLAASLEKHASRDEYAGRLLVDLVLDLGRIERLARLLTILPAEDAVAIEIRQSLLRSLSELESNDGEASERALKIRRTLLEKGVSIEAHLLSPAVHLDSRLSLAARQHVYFILHRRALDNLDDPAAVLRSALQGCTEDGSGTEALLAGLRAATNLETAAEAWVKSLELLRQGDVEGRHLVAIRPILIRLVEEDQDAAISALRELGAMFPQLSGRSRKDAASSLYEPLVQVFRRARLAEATDLFVAVAAADDRLADVASRALSDAMGPRFLAASEELAASELVGPTAARFLLQLRESLARQVGSSEWPEIRGLVAVRGTH